MTRARLLALALCAPLLGASYWPMTNDSDVASGQEAFGRGDYAAAVTFFRKALGGKGDRARLHFDLGTALVHVAAQLSDAPDRERQLDLAIVSLRRAMATSQADLHVHVNYNLGCALLLRGRYDQAIAAYRQVLRANSDHDDARHNLELTLMAERASKAGNSAVADALRKLGAEPAQGNNAGEATGQGTGAGAAASETSGAASSETSSATSGAASATSGATSGAASGAAAGEAEAGPAASPNQSGHAGARVETGRQGAGDVMKADLGPQSRPGSDQGISLQQKLDALERRSGELRRANMLRKTEARLREPDKKRRDQ